MRDRIDIFKWKAVLCTIIAITGCSPFQTSNSEKTPSAIDAAGIAKSQAVLALQKAEAAEQRGKTDEAIRYYAQARSLDPELGYLSRRLAVLYDQRGDDAQAQAAYDHALQLEPQNAELLNDYGVFFLHREQWSVAETWFRRCLDVNPNQQRALNNLAMSLAMQNRLAESFDAFAQVVGPAAAYSNIGVLLIRQGRTDEARDHFHRALAIDRSIKPAIEFLSRLEQPPTNQRY